MPLKSNVSLTFLASCLFAAPAFAGYEYPLPSPEIRNAYFLGQRDDSQTAEFLSPYALKFTKSQTGDYVITEVDVLTPYVQVIQRGARQTPGDSEVQTETDLVAHPFRFIVKVVVAYSYSHIAHIGPANDSSRGTGQDFSVQAGQAHELTTLGMTKAGFGWKHCPCGVILTAEFDASNVASAPMHITVHTPDGRSASADFDLSKLK